MPAPGSVLSLADRIRVTGRTLGKGKKEAPSGEFSGLISKAKDGLGSSMRPSNREEKPKTPVVEKSESDMKWEVSLILTFLTKKLFIF